MAEAGGTDLDEVFEAFGLRNIDLLDRIFSGARAMSSYLHEEKKPEEAHESPNLLTRAAFILFGISLIVERL